MMFTLTFHYEGQSIPRNISNKKSPTTDIVLSNTDTAMNDLSD